VLFGGLARETEAGSSISLAVTSQVGNRPNWLDYQTGVPVCEQTENLVPNPGFEQGSGAPWQPSHWYPAGTCLFAYDDPGPDSPVSAEICASASRDEDCRLVTAPIAEIPVEPGRFYDYAAWVRTDLIQGDAYLRIVFWRCPAGPPDCEYVGEGHTTSVTDTQGTWVQVTGSVQAPATAEYARVEAVLSHSSVGCARFDDIFLGLATCLEISKYGDPDPVAPGQALTYTIVYSNTGREKATDVHIIETYDEYVDFEQAQPPPLTGTTNVWGIPELPPGTGGTITVVVRVEDDEEGCVALVNCVQIRSAETVKPVYACSSTIISHGCRIVLYLPEAEKSGVTGHPTDYDVILVNAGSCDGQADLVATSSSGWPIIITPPPPYIMPSGGLQDVTVSLVVPQDVLDGTVDLVFITATLVCGPPCNQTVTATAIVTTTVKRPEPLLVISGPTTGFVHTAYTFTASVSPITSSFPITWIWQATEQSDVVTYTYAPSHTACFTWSATGTKTITVTATNTGGAVSDTYPISIEWHKVYLPLVLRRWLPGSGL